MIDVDGRNVTAADLIEQTAGAPRGSVERTIHQLATENLELLDLLRSTARRNLNDGLCWCRCLSRRGGGEWHHEVLCQEISERLEAAR